jgi:hypothetical protein
LTVKAGHANVIAHVHRVLGMLATGSLDPTPLVTHHMALDDAPDAYELYDRREALQIVLTPYRPFDYADAPAAAASCKGNGVSRRYHSASSAA